MSTNCYANANSMNKGDPKKKFIKTFDLSQIAEDPMDIFLESLGLWKKRIARDGSCLFRAVAEQIYPCQLYHTKVRNECVDFMSKNKQDYEKYVSIPFDDYLQSMKNPLEYGGQLEIFAMSKLYKRDFIIYQQPNSPSIDVTQNGYKDKFLICYSFNNHFDAVFTKTYRDNLALIQSLVYEILYDRVFGSSEQVEVARRLLRKSDTIYPKEYMDAKSSLNVCDENDNLPLSVDYNSIDKDMNNKNDIDNNNNYASNQDKYDSQKMPLPYKVAKSLDPVIYRNTAFDAWLATKKEYEEELNQKQVMALQPGERCLVRLGNYASTWMVAYLQSLHNDFANVMVPDLQENHCVSFENIKPFMDYSTHQSHIHHVQKLVQPINSQFSQIFANSENKRRNMKKKQFAMKKSLSFHAFSTELPTLHEVNEDQGGDDLFQYHQAYEFYNPVQTQQPGSYNYNGPHMVHSFSSYANFSNEKVYNSYNNTNNNNNQTKGSNSHTPTNTNNNNNKKKQKFNYKTWNNPVQNYTSNGLIGVASNQPGIYGPSNPINNNTIAQATYTNAPYANGTPSFLNNPYMYAPPPPPPPPIPQCDNNGYYYANTAPPVINNTNNNSKQINGIDQQHDQRRRHGSSDSFLNNNNNNKQSTSGTSFQQVPQQQQQQSNQMASELNNLSATSNYLLMPAPPVATQVSIAPPVGTMQRSHSYHSGISNTAYDPISQSANSGPTVYMDLYIPQHPQHVQPNPQSMYATAANGQSLIYQQSQQVLMNKTTSSTLLNTNGAPLYTNGCMENSLNYDMQYSRMHDNPNESLLNANDPNRQNMIWNSKNTKLDMGYNENQNGISNPQLCYATNCFVVNIDGPINFNATHSILDDGSDLKMNDINTLRFFYNLGIEYYRMYLVNNAQPNFYYQTSSNANNAPIMNHPMSNKMNTPSTLNCANIQQANQDMDKLSQQQATAILNEHGSSVNNQQVPNNQSKIPPQPLMHTANQSRRVH